MLAWMLSVEDSTEDGKCYILKGVKAQAEDDGLDSWFAHSLAL